MKVAYLTSQYPKISHTFIRREIAGVEAAGLEVVRISVRRSHEDFVDARDRAELAKTRVLLDRGALGLLPAALATLCTRPLRTLRALGIALAMGWNAPQGLGRHLAYLAEACVLRRWALREGVEHVHVHFSTNPADVALLCRELGGPTFSFTAHRVESGTPSASSIARKVAGASFAVAISEDGRRRLLKRTAPEHASRIHVVRCGVDELFLRGEASPVPESRRLVCVARLSPEKGHAVLLRAAQRLAQEGLVFELALLGDGPERAGLERSARELGLQERVRFEGWASGETVRARLRESRALVLASHSEGLPIVLMEALALRRPVVSTSVGGIPELVEAGFCGWLVPAGSDGELADAMRAALTRPAAELDAMGARGAERVASVHDPVVQGRAMARLLLDTQYNRQGGRGEAD